MGSLSCVNVVAIHLEARACVGGDGMHVDEVSEVKGPKEGAVGDILPRGLQHSSGCAAKLVLASGRKDMRATNWVTSRHISTTA